MTYVLIPDQWPRLARHLSPDAKALFLDVLAFERQDPQPGDRHLTIPVADIGRANYSVPPGEAVAAATDELTGCGWWELRGPWIYVGGPPAIAAALFTAERLEANRETSRKSSRKHRATHKDAASSSNVLGGSASKNQTKPNQGDTSRDASRDTSRGGLSRRDSHRDNAAETAAAGDGNPGLRAVGDDE